MDVRVLHGDSMHAWVHHLDAVERADSTAAVNRWLLSSRRPRYHVAVAHVRDRVVGFAAADAHDGNIHLHQVCVADLDRALDPWLASRLVDEVIAACDTAWGDLLVRPDADVLAHLESRGWAVESASAESLRLSGARAA
mgnify:CR=1 FL=1